MGKYNLYSMESFNTVKTCRRKMYRRPFSGLLFSNTGSGYSTDTTVPNCSLKKTVNKTYEGPQFVTYVQEAI